MHLGAALPVMHCPVRQPEPGMHRLLPDRIARRREGGDIERADRNPAHRRIAVALPVQVAAAIRAEIEPDVGAAIGPALVDLPFALDPHLPLQPGGAEMEGCAGAALARLAVTEVDALRLARGDDFERPAMAHSNSFHWHSPGRRLPSIVPHSTAFACAASKAGKRAGSPRAMPHSVATPSTRAWRRAAASRAALPASSSW